MPEPKPFAAADAPAHWVRPRPFRISRVDLAVRIDLDARRIEGEVVHHVELPAHRDPSAAIELDQQDLDIRGVEIDGEPVPFSRAPGRLSIAAPATERFALRVRFAAEQPAKGMYFVAADASAGRVAMCWTQGAMEDHHWWFPCFDDPNNLATYRFAITHRSDLVGIANGRRERTVDAGDGWSTTTWVQDKPHVLYLVNVAVGAFVAVEDASGPVPITHWMPRGQETRAAAMFRSTAFAISWLSGWIGVPFAWERYGHLVVHDFMWGGMENTTLTTITDRVVMDARVQEVEDVDCDSLVIHELVHQWFGDLLTMKGWADIWLNESFATYLEARGTAAWRAHAQGRDEADALALELWGNRRAYLDEDGGRYRRALVTNRYADAYELFDRVAYEKGSLVLHHLCRLLGEDRFRAGLRLYVERHAHDLVETADFRQALEDATGKPLDWFIDQWTGRAGHPSLKVRVRHDAGHGHLLVEVEQLGIAADHQAWRLPTMLAWRTDAGIERLAVDLRRAKETLVVACAQAPRWTALDPDGELPAEWDEDDDVETLLARARDGDLAAQARARAVVALAGKHPSARLVAGVASLVGDGHPELVRSEALSALGRLRGETALRALFDLWPTLREPRLRRAAAGALARFARHDGATAPAAIAQRLIELGDADPSALVAGELFAARGSIEHPGATPLLRARLARPSWNQRLRTACVRGMGESGEAAALDDVLAVLATASEVDGVRTAACAAAAQLGARLPTVRDRVRRALEPLVDASSLHVRVAAARALARLGDPAGAGALSVRLARELYGNVRRVLREALDDLGKAAAVLTAVADLAKRLDEVERGRTALERRVEALEKRIDRKPD